MDYADVFRKLTYETAILIFLKKDGTVRLMLGTRNMSTIRLNPDFSRKDMGGHDNRCNINNGNLAVYDLILGEARSFHIDRLITIDCLGIANDKDELDKYAELFLEYKAEYEKTQPLKITMEMLN